MTPSCSSAARRARLLAAAAALALPLPAPAQTPASAPDPADHLHDVPQDVVVTAPFARSTGDVLSGTSVVSGEELTRELRPTIGETLARQPGVSSTSFGPNASRPVLRGLQGERVRILTDGIGSFDVSNTSVDHAVAINPLTADRIEVLRGPAALLFGSSAIGGVVNVVDSRIPRRVPEEAIHVDAAATYGSAARERTAGAAIDVPLGSRIVAHVDGSYTKTGDLRTGGFVLAPTLRTQATASADPAVRALAGLNGRLPNSSGRSWEVAGGAAVIADGGNLGFSVSRLENLYGVPLRYSLDPAAEVEAVRLDIAQTRGDLRAEVDLGAGLVERLRFRAGVADYQHRELEETGEVGTTFFNQSLEARLELVQARRGGWKGAFGGQMFIRDFDVVGEEKFVPKNETQQFGAFTLQTLDAGSVKAEAGARYERTISRAHADADLGNPALRRSFGALSGSIGASIGGDALKFGVNLTHSERAPAAEELFANGPHAGTQAFEVGDPGFGLERSNGVEATLKGEGNGYSFGLSAYHSWFDGFIYESPTGAVEDDLPVFQYLQADARLYGFEAEASARLARIGGAEIQIDGVADYTRATIEGAGPVPRIPPLRLLGGLEMQGARADARVEVEHTTAQTRVATFETPTDGFTMVNLSLAWRPFPAMSGTSLSASVNNLFDVEARRHASFLKDYAPLAGRDVRVSARLSF